MSMLSAQCDELRSMAESVGLEMPQAATLMMKAADTIWELRNKCADLVDERERLFRANVEKNGEILRLVGENSKLRELVVEVFECARRGAACETCKVNNDGYACVYIMREMGIEVDDGTK